MTTLETTDFQFACDTERYQGKVRDVYALEAFYLALVATDRVSAFDHQLRQAIPFKGQVLNRIAAEMLQATRHICKNHLLDVPHPNVMIGLKVEPYPVEIIVRGHLCGHAWRQYNAGHHTISGVTLPPGLKENDPLPEPIITPSTKSTIGPDIDISEQEILKSGLVPADEYALVKQYALRLFEFGQSHADKQGLILADTKYEFGMKDFDIYLMDEIHTPDSSRYFYKKGFEHRQAKGEPQKQLSKEYLREWLMEQGFQGKEGQALPDLPSEVVEEVSRRYIEVYETLVGETFPRVEIETSLQEDVRDAIRRSMKALNIEC